MDIPLNTTICLKAHTGNNLQNAFIVRCENTNTESWEQITLIKTNDNKYIIQSKKDNKNLQVQRSGRCVFENHNEELWEKFDIETDENGQVYFISCHTGNVIQCNCFGHVWCANKNRAGWKAWTIIYLENPHSGGDLMKRKSSTSGVVASGGAAGAIAGISACSATASGLGFIFGGIAAGSSSSGTCAACGGVGAGLALFSLSAMAVGALGAGISYGIMQLLPKPISVEPERRCGVKSDFWMVLTEEGVGNVVYYSCLTEEHAWEFFNNVCSMPLARIIFDPAGNERSSAGWNRFALTTIRNHYQGSISSSCSRSFEIPSELLLRPVQFDRDCDFLKQRQTNPVEMNVRKIVNCISRFPQKPPAVRLVNCAEVNEGIHNSLQELQLGSHHKMNPTCQLIDCDHEVGNSMEQSVLFDVRPLLHVNENSMQEDQSSLMTGDENSLQPSTTLEGIIEIAPSVNSSCIAEFCGWTDATPVEPTDAFFAAESKNRVNSLDLINEKNGNGRKRRFIHLVEESTDEEAELNASHTSITLGPITLSSVTDASNCELGDDLSINSEDSNAINNSPNLPACEGEECTTPVSEFELVPIVPLVQSLSDSECGEEADSSNRSEGDMDGWDLVSDEEIFANAFQSIGSSMFNSSTSGLPH